MRELISVAEAREIIMEAVGPLPPVRKNLSDALYCTLAEDVRSDVNLPPFDNSGMDGYAVAHADLGDIPVELKIIDDVPAGAYPKEFIRHGTCVRVMTGAPIPEGADTVIPVEGTEAAGEDVVRILRAAAPGEHVRRAGEDVRAGDVVLIKGTVVTPPVCGMLAALGVENPAVACPPVVAVITTGDELVDASEAPGPGQIRNSNGPALAAQVVSAGGVPLAPVTVRDSEQHLRAAIENALQADVIVLSGGVSVGVHDHVKLVLAEMGMKTLFWRVRQRPGKPMVFGTLDGKPVFGLPGNPVSSSICFEEYVRPCLAAMLGRKVFWPDLVPAILTDETKKRKGLYYFTRGIARFGQDGRLYVRDTGPQGSGLYSSMVRANCVIHLPEEAEDQPAGSEVSIEWAQWLPPGAFPRLKAQERSESG